MNTALDTLVAEAACRDLVLAAADAVDSRDFLAFADLFEMRGVLVRPDGTELVGRPAIVAAYAARDPERLTRHLVSNQRVRVDLAAGTAQAACTVLLWSGRHSDASTPRGRPADALQQVGEIRDLLAKTPEGWRIRRREAWFTLFRS
ncbi:MAG: nuclear transport factor 2 family protein [Hydrogenophaga sp.]|uniref:nuclear transport factor 2 family protein n=1 Tax=Hydrogenophaga sp. TaxID=1904254 RepID=UPI003D9B8E5A